MEDMDARSAIVKESYEHYLSKGLRVIVNVHEIAEKLDLEAAQARRCIDYLSDKGMIKPMTWAGGFSPTVALVDEIERMARQQ